MICEIALLFPEIKFLAYTKAIRILKALKKSEAKRISDIKNLSLYISTMTEDQYNYVSSDKILSLFPIAHCGEKLNRKMIFCPEQKTGKIQCDTCKVCWLGLPVLFEAH